MVPLQASVQAVTVTWYDRSTTEESFVVYRRDRRGAWQVVERVPTRDRQGAAQSPPGPGVSTGGYDYSYTDTAVGLSGQCYTIAAVDASGAAAYSPEECTVRPDPRRFPQSVPGFVRQWSGLSDVNDGTGDLQASRGSFHASLTHASETFGVDLGWSGHAALWKVEAQGSPDVMYGQAVALRVWGGGWLTYGRETWGVDLVLSSTPSYEWYVLGGQPGAAIAPGAPFALWDDQAQRYLVHGHETFGVDLEWHSEPGGTTGQVMSDSVELMYAQPPVYGSVPAGYGVYRDEFTVEYSRAMLLRVTNSPAGVTVVFLKPGHLPSDCADPSAVVTLPPGATLSLAQMETLWGSDAPSLPPPLRFFGCAATSSYIVELSVGYWYQYP